MKKGIIVTAIIFIVSSILVIVSAVALGASGISQLVGYLRSDDSTNLRQGVGEFAGRIAESAEMFGEKVEDSAEDFADKHDLFDGRDFAAIGNPDLQIAGDRASSIDVSDKDEIIIHADIAQVLIRNTTGTDPFPKITIACSDCMRRTRSAGSGRKPEISGWRCRAPLRAAMSR